MARTGLPTDALANLLLPGSKEADRTLITFEDKRIVNGRQLPRSAQF
jgi:hypothetical protein